MIRGLGPLVPASVEVLVPSELHNFLSAAQRWFAN